MWYFILLFFIPVVYLTVLSFFIKPFFEKAGKGSYAAVPFKNVLGLLEIIGKPKWWMILLLIPVINYMTVYSILSELLLAYGEFSMGKRILGGLFSYIVLPLRSKDPKLSYVGPNGVKEGKLAPPKVWYMEWLDAGVYAIVAATFIRMLIFEAYNIPSSSMEKTLRVGDYLFVSKFHYGPRIAMTPIAFPFAHHTMPLINTKAYSEIIELPYKRLPGFQNVKRNDMVVFNLPAGDTVIEEFQSEFLYYQAVRQAAMQSGGDGRALIFNNYHVITRPVDKRENYIKRCVGIAGDTIRVVDDVLYLNGVKAWEAPTAQFSYLVETQGASLPGNIHEQYDFYDSIISIDDKGNMYRYMDYPSATRFRVCCTKETAKEIANIQFVKSVTKFPDTLSRQQDDNFPNDDRYFRWNVSDFGPLWLPEKGKSIQLNPNNIALYRRAICAYEGNKLEEVNGKYLLNGQPADSYTFKMNYYWMMGDNRNNSQDSRYWGYVPEDHIVGKAWFIWMSTDQHKGLPSGIRFNRIGTFVHSKYAPN